MKFPIIILALVFIALSACEHRKTNAKLEHLNALIRDANPGDTIKIKSGVYEDAVINFDVVGTPLYPIVLTAEPAGSVSFTGKSKLYISGVYGVVSGLKFENGSSPKKSILTYRSEDGKKLASHCRVTQCAFIKYSNEDRLHNDNWIEIYGQHNRFDHNYIGNKLNLGATLTLNLSKKDSGNFCSIDSNYFAERSRLGSNGGETVRIGSSAQSLIPGHIKVFNNYFDKCKGEVESVSVKSSNNEIKGNVFYECEGVLAMRHGNNNLISNNYFIGNNKPATGGIRVINAGHVIEGNYLSGLTGSRFFAALPVMNGVYNSPINRYHQVKDVIIRNNQFINCDQIAFGIGSDNERTAAPLNTVFESNAIYHNSSQWEIQIKDESSDVKFSKNKIAESIATTLDGFSSMDMEVYETEEKLQAIKDLKEPKLPIQKNDAGPKWLKKETVIREEKISGKSYTINQENKAELYDIFSKAQKNDTIWIGEEGAYSIDKPLPVKYDLTVLAKPGIEFPVFEPKRKMGSKGIIEIQDGISLTVKGICFSGRAGEGDIAYGILAVAPMLKHYNLYVENCRFENFNESHYAGIAAQKGTFADSIKVQNSWFKGISGEGVSLASQTGIRGKYNVEFLTLQNCVFANIMSSCVNLYRGGNDESTLGPYATIENCSFINSTNRELGSVLRMIGVQNAMINNCNFYDSGKSGRSILFEDPAWAKIDIKNINLSNSGRIQTFYSHRVDQNSISKNNFPVNTNQINNWELTVQ